MADGAVFGSRLVFPQERTALVGMTGVAGLVDGIANQIALAGGAMRVVATRAAHLAFAQRMTEGLGQTGALILVAGQADVGLSGLVEDRILRHMRRMATHARDVLHLVLAALPMHQLLAVVAGLALGDTDAGVLFLEGHVGGQGIIVHVRLAGAVAGGAGVVGHRRTTVGDHAMFGHQDRQHRVLRLLVMAADAFLVAGIVGAYAGLRSAGWPNHPGAEQQDQACQQRTSGLFSERPHDLLLVTLQSQELENLASIRLWCCGIWPVFDFVCASEPGGAEWGLSFRGAKKRDPAICSVSVRGGVGRSDVSGCHFHVGLG